MEKFIIRIPKNLTSYTFYNHFLHDLHKYCIEAFSSDLVLDLSLTKVIDPTVICSVDQSLNESNTTVEAITVICRMLKSNKMISDIIFSKRFSSKIMK